VLCERYVRPFLSSAVHQLHGGSFFFLLRIDYNDYLLQDTFPIIYASYKIWPLASVVNFALIPVEKRIVFLSMVGLIWGIFLSLTAANQ
jgi:hypothetical protein